jgi:hypothetical protein
LCPISARLCAGFADMTFRPAITRWLPNYDRSWLRRDAVSGL